MQEQIRLYAPRYWGYWLLFGMLWLIVQLPQRLRMATGRLLGKLLFKLAPYRVSISAANIMLAFPQDSESQQQQLLRRHIDSIGCGIIETGMAWFLPQKRLLALSRFEADPHALALVQNQNIPVILVGSHSTLMELGVRLLSLYVSAGGMYRPLSNRFFHHWIKRRRSRAATELVHFQDMRHTLRLLQNGDNLWYALDQDMGHRVSVFVPFFGTPAACVNVLPKLHRRTKAHCVPVFMWREKNGYVVRLGAEIPLTAGESAEQVMEKVNTVYENEIRRYPEQYFWLHRRYKNRPDGSFYPYPKKR